LTLKGSPEASGTQDELVEQRLATLQDENRRLSEQIKRRVRIEHELYQFQEQLDDQIRIYRHLYEVGKKLNATLDLGEILQTAIQFVLYQLNFERCVALLYGLEANSFYVEALDGYYDEASRARVTGLRFSVDDPLLAPTLAASEQVICAEACDQSELLALGQVLEMDEYVAFPLGGEPQQPIGLLIAGNTANSLAYHPQIEADSDFVVGLANLVSQVATAIRMRREIQARELRLLRLTAELQRSRERLVTTREEERRRLRRDLHDGLGPTVASLALKLDAARKLVRRKPEDAEDLLSRLKDQTQDTVVEVRRLVYDLRPPALDDLGLVAAIRQQAESHGFVVEGSSGETENEVAAEDGLIFASIEAPEDLPSLSAAVEVAAYRIAQEALTNIARHAHAKRCRVRLSVDRAGGALTLEVRDDGVGMPEGRRAGVGLSSMRERAEELGGRCEVEPEPEGGTRVLARLPLPTSEKHLEGARSLWRAQSESS
jgi:signal transduction histidine kinase